MRAQTHSTLKTATHLPSIMKPYAKIKYNSSFNGLSSMDVTATQKHNSSASKIG